MRHKNQCLCGFLHSCECWLLVLGRLVGWLIGWVAVCLCVRLISWSQRQIDNEIDRLIWSVSPMIDEVVCVISGMSGRTLNSATFKACVTCLHRCWSSLTMVKFLFHILSRVWFYSKKTIITCCSVTPVSWLIQCPRVGKKELKYFCRTRLEMLIEFLPAGRRPAVFRILYLPLRRRYTGQGWSDDLRRGRLGGQEESSSQVRSRNKVPIEGLAGDCWWSLASDTAVKESKTISTFITRLSVSGTVWKHAYFVAAMTLSDYIWHSSVHWSLQ